MSSLGGPQVLAAPSFAPDANAKMSCKSTEHQESLPKAQPPEPGQESCSDIGGDAVYTERYSRSNTTVPLPRNHSRTTFASLPQEIVDMIWTCLGKVESPPQYLCHLSETTTCDSLRLGSITYDNQLCSLRPPLLSQICRNSREFARRRYRPRMGRTIDHGSGKAAALWWESNTGFTTISLQYKSDLRDANHDALSTRQDPDGPLPDIQIPALDGVMVAARGEIRCALPRGTTLAGVLSETRALLMAWYWRRECYIDIEDANAFRELRQIYQCCVAHETTAAFLKKVYAGPAERASISGEAREEITRVWARTNWARDLGGKMPLGPLPTARVVVKVWVGPEPRSRRTVS
ncbi:hypothetical protein B0H67DRAFT_233778 [Lasiosphaeris hirsuta]|uniref:Uncharacterized protein n=1 Tax=Lasiosphaeris hirsuta TaxID=260670 RepID=A0AA40AFV6_9PEZI|nr:hypothetical protein B0H67DRAFT_233778 [Lasiosphaeris hirsuta]